MKMRTIEIDENLWSYLQKHAEPFVDTPNSVLNRILFETSEAPSPTNREPEVPAVSIQGIPKSLAQILEVVYEMEINGYSRTEATKRVAHKRGTSPQTITDKYCRQIGKKAHEIDLAPISRLSNPILRPCCSVMIRSGVLEISYKMIVTPAQSLPACKWGREPSSKTHGFPPARECRIDTTPQNSIIF
jgi:hypothetical protein